MNNKTGGKTVLVKNEDIAKCASRVKNRLRYVTSILKDFQPPADVETCLLIVHEGMVKGCVAVTEEPISIGRSDDADIQLMDVNVSREHARVERGDEDWTLIDNDSSNGVFVNGSKTSEKDLRDGDLITIGEFELIFLKNDSL